MKACQTSLGFHSVPFFFSIQENTVFVTELNASDPDGDFLSYSILNGDDANAFSVSISSRELTILFCPQIMKTQLILI